jgi:hypothetical protein
MTSGHIFAPAYLIGKNTAFFLSLSAEFLIF